MNTIIVGQEFGHWRVLVVDGRHTTCMCRCGTARVLSTAELINHTVASSCGCAPLTAAENSSHKREMSERAAAVELRQWKPGR